MSMMLVSVGQSTMAVNPSIKFWRPRIRSASLVADMVVRVCGMKLTCYVEDKLGLSGNITRRLDNGAFAGLIYLLLVLTD